MHRRRKKSAPREDRTPLARAPSTRSRRRPKPGAHVPPELRLPPETAESLLKTERPPREAAPPAAPAARPREGGGPGKSFAKKTKQPPVILVTGFEPFGGEAVNPSWQVCERLPQRLDDARIETCLVPCVFARAVDVVMEAIERHDPALVVCIGQAGGRSHIGVERIAITIDDAPAADNAGDQPLDRAIAPDGPPAYFSTLPVKAMVTAMREAGVPAEVSNSAGTYVCNHLMYGVLHALRSRGRATRAGFVHVPYAEGQVLDKPGVAALSIDSMVRGMLAALGVAMVKD